MSFDAFASAGGSPASGGSSNSGAGATSSAPPAQSTTITQGSPAAKPSHGSPAGRQTASKSRVGQPVGTLAPQATPSAGGAQPGAALSQVLDQGEGETPDWQPNFKLKVMDKEHEIPEIFRSAITNAESEKAFREVYEKALGLDHVKPKLQEFQKKYAEVNGAHTNVMAGIQDLREAYQRGDFESFFNKMQIPEEKILQWVIKKAQYNQLPPDQRQAMDERRASENRAIQLEKQNRSYQQQIEAQTTQAKSYGLQVTLGRPDVQSFASSFDETAGKPGSFREAVRQHGDYVYRSSNGRVDLTPEQAVQQVMERYGKFVQPRSAPQGGQGNPNPIQQAPTKPLPNLGSGRGGSAATGKPKFTSLDQLKAHARKMGA